MPTSGVMPYNIGLGQNGEGNRMAVVSIRRDRLGQNSRQ